LALAISFATVKSTRVLFVQCVRSAKKLVIFCLSLGVG
jgi:hypothetical protein